MPPKKASSSSATDATIRPSAALLFFKPTKASTIVRTAPLKNPYLVNNKKAASPTTLAPVLPQKKLSRRESDDEENDDFGNDLDFDGVFSDDDLSGDSMDRNFITLQSPSSSVTSSTSSFKDKALSVVRIDFEDGIHQDDLSADEKLLRQFDLASKYGPCLGLTRLERWERASMLDLDPPLDVRVLLEKQKNLDTPVFASQV